MRKRKSLEEKQAEKKRIEKFYQDQYNRKLMKKASELNKIMNGKDVKHVTSDGTWYSVFFKNGQVFNFTFVPPHITGDRKIIPMLE